MTKVLIVIKGGNIQWVYSTDEIEYIILDHDNIEAGDEVPTIEDIRKQDDKLTEWQIEDYLTCVRVDKVLKDCGNCNPADLVVEDKLKFRDVITYLSSKKHETR